MLLLRRSGAHAVTSPPPTRDKRHTAWHLKFTFNIWLLAGR